MNFKLLRIFKNLTDFEKLENIYENFKQIQKIKIFFFSGISREFAGCQDIKTDFTGCQTNILIFKKVLWNFTEFERISNNAMGFSGFQEILKEIQRFHRFSTNFTDFKRFEDISENLKKI